MKIKQVSTKVFYLIADKFTMDCGNQKLFNLIIFIGLVVTISTTIILPSLDWERESVVSLPKDSLKIQAAVVKRP
jgi:hypothetical protein